MKFKRGDIFKSSFRGNVIMVLENSDESNYTLRYNKFTRRKEKIMNVRVKHMYGVYKGRIVQRYNFAGSKYIGHDSSLGTVKKKLKKIEL